MNDLILKPFHTGNLLLCESIASLWNAACSQEFAITPYFVRYNLQANTGIVKEGRLVLLNDKPWGFIIAEAMPEFSRVSPPQMGWISALAVAPHFQHQGIGSRLLDWAEGWLKLQGCQRIRTGGNVRTFVPALPVELQSEGFFFKRGFIERQPEPEYCWDVSRDLGDELLITRKPCPMPEALRPAGATDRNALDEFISREFPGRWWYEYTEFVANSGRISDINILTLDGKVEGFAWITMEDSARPLNRYYLHRYPHPWGQLGPIGVSQSIRKEGWGGYLLQFGLERLRALGVRGCVIDWTSLLNFYGKYGFKPYHKYHVMVKQIG